MRQRAPPPNFLWLGRVSTRKTTIPTESCGAAPTQTPVVASNATSSPWPENRVKKRRTASRRIGRLRLTPGSYLLLATPAAGGRTGKQRRATFRIAR